MKTVTCTNEICPENGVQEHMCGDPDYVICGVCHEVMQCTNGRAVKTLVVVAGLAIALMFIVTSCSDRTRYNCQENPTAERCNP
jgi:hypothetical protein